MRETFIFLCLFICTCFKIQAVAFSDHVQPCTGICSASLVRIAITGNKLSRVASQNTMQKDGANRCRHVFAVSCTLNHRIFSILPEAKFINLHIATVLKLWALHDSLHCISPHLALHLPPPGSPSTPPPPLLNISNVSSHPKKNRAAFKPYQ